MTKEQKLLQKLLNDRVLSRQSLKYYAELILPNFDWSSLHHSYLFELLSTYDLNNENDRLAISLPPRTGKSTIITQVYTTWVLLRNPSAQIVIASYSASLADSHLSNVKKILESQNYTRLLGYQQRTKKTKTTNNYIETEQNGFIRSVGIGGTLTGTGATHMIIDDPIGSRQDAESTAISDTMWNWYLWVANTRLAPQSRLIVDQTRWCTQDLIGRILRTPNANAWKYVRIPAICDRIDDDPLGRELGDSIWPSKWTVEKYKEIEKIDRYSYTTMYQQLPINEIDSYISQEWLHVKNESSFLDDIKDKTLIDKIRVYDLAYSDKSKSDYSATCIGCIDNNGHIYIYNIKQYKLKYPEMKNIIIDQGKKDNIPIWLEKNGPQLGIYEDILKNLQKYNVIVKGLSTSQSKNSRVLLLADAMRDKRVTLYTTNEYHNQVITQLLQYNGVHSNHDDIIDCLSHCVITISKCVSNQRSVIIPKRDNKGVNEWM